MNLTEQEILKIHSLANEYSIHPAKIFAVMQVEASGAAFFEDNRIKILFERHKFWKNLIKHGLDPRDYLVGNDDILSEKAGGYVYGMREYDRLERAVMINREAALESASWGMFQILGEHYKFMNFESVHDFINSINDTADNVAAFLKLISGEWNKSGSALPQFSAIDALRRHDATFFYKMPLTGSQVFAWKYNGWNFHAYKYDEQIDIAIRHFLAHPPRPVTQS